MLGRNNRANAGGASGVIHAPTSTRSLIGSAGISSAGMSGRKKKHDPSKKHNIDKIKAKSSRTLPEEFHFKPQVSESFLENWLDFPVDRNVSVIFSSCKMWLVWLLWNSKGMAGLDPKDTTIRARICSQLSVLGTAAGLFLVIAIAGFLVLPELKHQDDKVWLDAFGVIMFTASVCLIFYIGVSLTLYYPLVESLRDDVAFDAFENYQNRIGGYEVYLFFVGMQLVCVSLFVAAKILYSLEAIFAMFGVLIVVCIAVTHISRQCFLALDPISSMHLGLTNDPEEQYRAELMSHFILRKIPNNIMVDDLGEDIFALKHESQKYEETKVRRASMQQEMELAAMAAKKSVNQSEWGGNNSSVEGANIGDGVNLFRNEKPDHANSLEHDLSVQDLEKNSVPFVDNSKKFASSIPLKEEVTDDTGSSVITLQIAFCDKQSYIFQHVGLSLSDSVAAHERLVKAGCASWEELLAYLDDHKQPRQCNCQHSSARASTATHIEECALRQVGAWTGALIDAGIPCFHARKIVLELKKHLK